MTRVSTFCIVSCALAVLALSANGANAETITHVNTPTVHVQTPTATGHTPQATGSHFQATTGKGAGTRQTDTFETEEISYSFRSIDVTNTGGKGFGDSWGATTGSSSGGSKVKQYKPGYHPEWK